MEIMETLLHLCMFFSFSLILYKLILQNRIQHKNLPPSPRRIPVLGHFHLLKKPLQQALNDLSNRYGPVVFLWFGSRPVLLVSSSSAIEDCFTKNDIVFANRPLFPSRRKVEYNFSTIGIAPYGHHWRNLRRLTTIEIFSSTSIQMSSTIRESEIRYFIKQIFVKGARKVELNSFFYMLAFNIMMTMVSGNRYFEGDELDPDGAGNKFEDIKKMFSPNKTLALGDFFPFLRWSDFLAMKRKRVHRKRDLFMQGLIDTHQSNRSSYSGTGSRKGKTILDVMLSLSSFSLSHLATSSICLFVYRHRSTPRGLATTMDDSLHRRLIERERFGRTNTIEMYRKDGVRVSKIGEGGIF